jgi:hypothetical protein
MQYSWLVMEMNATQEEAVNWLHDSMHLRLMQGVSLQLHDEWPNHSIEKTLAYWKSAGTTGCSWRAGCGGSSDYLNVLTRQSSIVSKTKYTRTLTGVCILGGDWKRVFFDPYEVFLFP